MPFSFPSSPSIGDKSTQNSREYEWSGYAWEIVATPAALSASVITSGTLDAARLPLATTGAAGAVIVGTGLGVSSGTVSVTYGTTGGTACQGNDSRLSDTRTPTDGSVTTAKIANDAVTYAKLQNVSATDRLLGRSSAGAGDVEEITCTAFGRSLIDDADAAAARTTLSVQPTASPAFTGAATFTVSSGSSVPVSISNSGTGNSLVVATNFIVDGSGRLGLFGAPRAFEACAVLGTAPSSSQTSIAFRAQTTFPSSTTVDAASFSSFPVTQAASYTLANLYHFACAQQAFGAGSTVTNQYGLFVDSTLTGATNNYAVYTGIASGTGRWAIYAAGTAASYFGGQVQISAGSASAPGIAFSGDTNTGLAQLGGADTASLVTAGVERVRVDANGGLRIGGTADVTVSDEKLSVLGGAIGVKTSVTVPVGVWNTNTSGTRQYIYFYVNTGTLTGTINTDGTTTAYNTTSDYRLKTVLRALPDATQRLESLLPCEYVWKSTGLRGEGFLAHELAESVPHAVSGTKDAVTDDGAIDPQQVDLSKIVPLLVKALQESNARIAALEERLNHA